MTQAGKRRGLHWLLAAAGAVVLAATGLALWRDRPGIDPRDEARVAAGRRIYDAQCAACHGAQLEGQPNWRERLPNGRLPAPPHNAEGHTWHHPDQELFGLVKEGLKPGKYAPPGYESDMPAFGGRLSDEEIRSVLAYLKSTWPREQLAYQRQRDAVSRGPR